MGGGGGRGSTGRAEPRSPQGCWCQVLGPSLTCVLGCTLHCFRRLHTAGSNTQNPSPRVTTAPARATARGHGTGTQGDQGELPTGSAKGPPPGHTLRPALIWHGCPSFTQGVAYIWPWGHLEAQPWHRQALPKPSEEQVGSSSGGRSVGRARSPSLPGQPGPSRDPSSPPLPAPTTAISAPSADPGPSLWSPRGQSHALGLVPCSAAVCLPTHHTLVTHGGPTSPV